MDASKLVWGNRSCKVSSAALWGARAILDLSGRKPYLDLVWDRQSVEGDVPEQVQLLAHTLNEGGALEALRQFVAKDGIGEEDEGSTQLKGVVFHYRATAGYCYITACLAN